MKIHLFTQYTGNDRLLTACPLIMCKRGIQTVLWIRINIIRIRESASGTMDPNPRISIGNNGSGSSSW